MSNLLSDDWRKSPFTETLNTQQEVSMVFIKINDELTINLSRVTDFGFIGFSSRKYLQINFGDYTHEDYNSSILLSKQEDIDTFLSKIEVAKAKSLIRII